MRATEIEFWPPFCAARYALSPGPFCTKKKSTFVILTTIARSREIFAKIARARGEKVGKIAERKNALRSTNFRVWLSFPEAQI